MGKTIIETIEYGVENSKYIDDLTDAAKLTQKKTVRDWLICKITGKGCFVAGTPVLAMGMITLPIQDIQPGQLVLANTWVNESHTATASTDNTYYPSWKDPFTSDDQRKIDKIALDKEQWYKVSMEMPHFDGTSSRITLLRPDSWLTQNAIHDIGDQIWLSMPEQNLQGYATVNSLAHYRFQKIPEDNNPSDDLAVSPVTGIFVHESTDVWTIGFDNGDTLGVTGSHPIYSLDANGWVLANSLTTDNQVLTKSGTATVTYVKKQSGRRKVYNLEVRDLHNFLVGIDGVVVHNSCAKIVENVKNMTPSQRIAHIKDGWEFVIKSSDDIVPFFKQRRYFQDLMEGFRYKAMGFKGTSQIADNFKAIDFYKLKKVTGDVIDAGKVISMKTTIITDVNKWKKYASVKKNIQFLQDGLNGGIKWAGKTIKYTHPEIHIYMPKDKFTQALANSWKTTLEAENSGIKFFVSTLEKYVK